MKKKIVFLHPDLGIGGAERLVVDAALALKSHGHSVHFVTNHHDPKHCFEETINGQFNVTVIADWLPRSTFGRCRAFWAYLRIIFAAIYISWKGVPKSSDKNSNRYRPDIIICDQISACIPFIKNRESLSWLFPNAPKKTVFYCHFPDKLLTKRQGTMKKLYRYGIDWVEEVTTGMADKILVNSKFTAGVFQDSFKSLSSVPDVVYPSLHTKSFDDVLAQHKSTLAHQKVPDTFLLLSINRYERKKNLKLALKTLAHLHKNGHSKTRLVMMGGHDPLCKENVEHLEELKALSEDLNLSSTGSDPSVIFMTNATAEEKINFLRISDALLYTPSGEHFGIVPVEAMYVGLPVIAINDSAGPTESVKNKETGFLCESDEVSFAEAIVKLIHDTKLRNLMKDAGRKRVSEKFSFESFADQLNKVVTEIDE